MATMLQVKIRHKKFEVLNGKFEKLFSGFTKDMATVGAWRVREQIYTQSGNWKKLSSAYVDYKKKHKLDPRILIATGDYVKSIQARYQNKQWMIAPDAAHMKIGLWLEYGTKKMPRRPHFRPVVEELQRDCKKVGKGHVTVMARAMETLQKFEEFEL